jgi:hypothetical protein
MYCWSIQCIWCDIMQQLQRWLRVCCRVNVTNAT